MSLSLQPLLGAYLYFFWFHKFTTLFEMNYCFETFWQYYLGDWRLAIVGAPQLEKAQNADPAQPASTQREKQVPRDRDRMAQIEYHLAVPLIAY